MDTTTQDLQRIKAKLEATIRSCQLELEAINKAIEVVAREQRSKPETPFDTPLPSIKNRDFAKLGLSEAIRRAVGPDFMIPSEIRDVMLSRGYPLPEQGKARLLNYVFVTSKRFAKAGEFERGLKDNKFAVRKPARRDPQQPTLESAATGALA